MSITLTQLRSFLAVINGGSVTAAAEELVVTQPAISAAVTALSREVGVTLFERAGRGVRPTPAGREFAAYAADVIGLLEQGRHAARDAEARGALTLTIAAVTTAAESFVPPLMRAFATAHPQIGLALDVGNRDHVLAVVLNHEADLAIGGRPPPQARIEAHAILANELMLIAAPDDPLAGGKTVSVARLAGRRWLLREPGSGHARGQRGVHRERRHRRPDHDPGLQRRDQAGGARRPRGVIRVARRGGHRARRRAARHHRGRIRPGSA